MPTYTRSDSSSPDFQKLVLRLDAELKERDGNENAFYAQFNKSNSIRHVIVVYKDDEPIGCGAIKVYSSDTMEVKRMFVPHNLRGEGIASGILNALEIWARELGYKKIVLETGKRQPEAIALYKKSKYKIIPNYGQYAGIENSVCFERQLI